MDTQRLRDRAGLGQTGRFCVAGFAAGAVMGVAEGLRLLLIDGGATSARSGASHIALALGVLSLASFASTFALSWIVLRIPQRAWFIVTVLGAVGLALAEAFRPEEFSLPWGHVFLVVLGLSILVATFSWPWRQISRAVIPASIIAATACIVFGATSEEACDRIEDRGLFTAPLISVARNGFVGTAVASAPAPATANSNSDSNSNFSAPASAPAPAPAPVPAPAPATAPASAPFPDSLFSVPPWLRGESSPPPLTPRAVVLITIDSLRADHVGAYGYRRDTTPAIDRFAKTALRFDAAYAQAPHTWRSMPSLVTGRYPSHVAMSRARPPVVFANNPHLGLEIARLGVTPEAVLTHWLFDPKYGLSRGFTHWNLDIATRNRAKAASQPTAARAIDLALARFARWESSADAPPLFLWVHIYDPHAHWIRHAGIRSFGDEPADLYDHEIAYSDHHVGRLLARVRASRHADAIGVLITSDHGEGLGDADHGVWYHGQALFDHQIRVPLLVAGPGVAPGVESRPAGLIDIAPTLVAWFGGTPSPAFEGVDLIRRREALGDRRLYSELLTGPNSEPMQAVIDGRWKLIRWSKLGRTRLFNLDADPREWRNRARRDPDVFARLEAALSTFNAVGHPY